MHIFNINHLYICSLKDMSRRKIESLVRFPLRQKQNPKRYWPFALGLRNVIRFCTSLLLFSVAHSMKTMLLVIDKLAKILNFHILFQIVRQEHFSYDVWSGTIPLINKAKTISRTYLLNCIGSVQYWYHKIYLFYL